MTGHIPHNKHIWTAKEIAFIKANFYTMTNQQLADGLGMKLTSVRTMCYALGLKRMELEYWTEEQITFLKKNYRKYGDTELAAMFAEVWHKDKGWSKKHIEKKRRYLNLNRTKREQALIKRRNVEFGCFAVGQKHTWETRGVTAEGETKVWTNHETGRPFMVIKLKDGFVHYAPWLYVQTYGPIPEGKIVRLKDNDPFNVVPENLILVTRAEHAILNSKARLPKELREVKQLNNQLKKVIHEQSRKAGTAIS